MTPLEALEKLVDDITFSKEDEEYRIIKTALKEYWLYKQDYERVMNEKNSLLEEHRKSQMKLKAFEIIKKKDVDIGWLKRAKDLHEYNSGMGVNSYSALTQEEYEVLNEVFKKGGEK